ncbi:hypothetical protein P3W24_15850 [Luteibacter sp. PPL201]|uniref:Uncharacterized protein n=1 Tax=Luteibacter sahnii TaxID=3021977 RepID=A0ABT6BEE8_9GAMM
MKPLLAALLLLIVPAASAQDWATSVRTDARAMHDDIARNHPGPFDPANRGFAARNDRGLALAVPMKVYRGRRRGSNVPLVPRDAYPGDLTDTAALERWIAGLR